LNSLFRIVRPHHFIKNLLIFLPILFIDEPIWPVLYHRLIPGFFAFCFLSSFVYIFNDIRDASLDKHHTIRSSRPIASGVISKKAAFFFGCLLLAVAVTINMLSAGGLWAPWVLMALYLVINIGYSSGLKNLPVIEIVILAGGFLMRILYGVVLSGGTVSVWLLLSIVFLSTYLGFGKRRNELLYHGTKSRKVLQYYKPKELNLFMGISFILSIAFYLLWCLYPGVAFLTPPIGLYCSIPIVIAILFRYHSLINKKAEGDPVDILLKDGVILSASFLYSGLILWVFL